MSAKVEIRTDHLPQPEPNIHAQMDYGSCRSPGALLVILICSLESVRSLIRDSGDTFIGIASLPQTKNYDSHFRPENSG
jgi:hypothetical protein